jgi:hypothetical protein
MKVSYSSKRGGGETHENFFDLRLFCKNGHVLLIYCIEAFEVTIFIRLFFTGFECKKGAIGMILTDIGNTASQ